MGAPPTVDVDFRKWGDRPHYRFVAERLGTDDAGAWLGVRAGSTYTGPVCGTYRQDFALLVPNDDWWVASFDLSNELELYVDVVKPAVWLADDHVTMVDLDLDVIRYRDGRVVLDDENEFEEHRVLYSYPDDVVQRARETADMLMDAVARRLEPFGVASGSWMRRLSEDFGLRLR